MTYAFKGLICTEAVLKLYLLFPLKHQNNVLIDAMQAKTKIVVACIVRYLC